MKKPEQKKFVKELLSEFTSELLAMLPRVPDDWDGRELRQWVSDNARNCTCNAGTSFADGRDSRRRKYEQEKITLNLI